MAKLALVTGASRGIGRATALRLARDGFDVVVHYGSHRERAEAVAEAAKGLGRRAAVVGGDFGRPEAPREVAAKALESMGDIDVLVNNAGIYERAKFRELDEAAWRRTLEVDLGGVFRLTQAIVPSMKARHGGRIVNVSSEIAFRGTPHGAHYAAAKAGLVGFTKALASELAPHRITVNAVIPGAIDTDIIAGDTPERRQARNRSIPLGRVGKAEEVAAAIAFLASDDAGWITGVTLHVSGGALMW